MRTQELAQETINLLNKDGWTRQRASAKNGARCMVQAMRDATNDNHADYIQLRKAVEHLLGRSCLEIWNDHPARTFSEVTALLKALT